MCISKNMAYMYSGLRGGMRLKLYRGTSLRRERLPLGHYSRH